ncbi:MAG: glycosyltransferase family 4 protein [Isosphaeraceae bacterium]
MAVGSGGGGGAVAAPRVLIVSEHAAVKFGGEAILPWHYFRLLRRRGIEAWLVVHERTRDELLGLLPEESGRIYFTPDTDFHKFADRAGSRLPARLSNATLGYLSRVSTQRMAKAMARRLIAELGVTVVHQPIPVSPRETSLLYDLDVPVVIGPMNGNMTYPPAFARGKAEGLVAISRRASDLAHRLMPGKIRADVLVVSNPRTREGLPRGVRGEVIELVENGVDLELWGPADRDRPGRQGGPVRFISLGRLVDWKAVDILIDALSRVEVEPAPILEIAGDGAIRPALEAQARNLGLGDRVRFLGWKSQPECAGLLREADALLLSSLYECGGAVVLEAMASAIPVAATAWGGPSDDLDDRCGFLIPPESRESMVAGFADAMTRLAADADLRRRMGDAGRERVEQHFDWDAKIDAMLGIYGRAIAAHRRTSAAGPIA